MKTMKRTALILVALMMAIGIAQAETLSLSGTVEAGVTIPVYAPIGGTVESVLAEQGVRVTAGDTLFTYRTEKTYASADGTVTGVFVQPGDDAETVAEQYGADLYIEGAVLYTVSASVSKAYSSVETTLVHTGETVYLLCRNNAERKGTGIITGIDGSNYTVTVTEGSFIAGDAVSIFRDSAYTDNQRIGRGTVARISPTAVTGSGAIINVAVKDGDSVKRGDLLLETLSGSFDAYEMTGTAVTAAETGVITSVSAVAGSAVSKGDIAVQIAPLSGMRVEADISADDRKELHAGDKVTIELEADESKTYEGTVRYITELPEEETEEVTYKAVIDFTPDENVVFGMAVVVTTGENSDIVETKETKEPEKAEETEMPEAPDQGEAPEMPEMPEDFAMLGD